MTPQYFYIDSGLYAGMVKNYVGLKGTLGSLVNYGSVALATLFWSTKTGHNNFRIHLLTRFACWPPKIAAEPIAVSSMVPDHLRWTINEDL